MKIFLQDFAIFALALNAIDFQHKIYLNCFYIKIKKIMQRQLELKNWYLHHYALCTFLPNFGSHFWKMDIFIFPKMSKIKNGQRI
jgi:hypothetical protein